MQEFETKLMESKDEFKVMIVWDEYIRKYAHIFPNNHHQLKHIADRATQYILASTLPKNSPLYVQIIIKHCLLSDHPLQTINHFRDLKIGTDCAYFYHIHARLYEKQNDMQKAKQIYMEGIVNKAQPEHVLKKRFNEFELRYTHITPQENKRKVHFIENEIVNPKKIKPPSENVKIIIYNTHITYFKPGSRYEPGQNWIGLMPPIPIDGRSVEEKLADLYFEKVESYGSNLSKKSVLIVNESMELDKTLDERAIERSLYESSTKKMGVLFNSKLDIFSEPMSVVTRKESMTSISDYKDILDVFNV